MTRVSKSKKIEQEKEAEELAKLVENVEDKLEEEMTKMQNLRPDFAKDLMRQIEESMMDTEKSIHLPSEDEESDKLEEEMTKMQTLRPDFAKDLMRQIEESMMDTEKSIHLPSEDEESDENTEGG